MLMIREKRRGKIHGTPFAIGKTTNFDAYWHYKE